MCGKKDSSPCSRCYVDFYCGEEHQQQDHARHRSGCRVVEIRTDERLGRHLVAKEDIPAGTVIMREFPLIYGLGAIGSRLVS